MMVAALMDMLDVTIVNVALPTIRGDIGASATQVEWVVSAYMLAFGATLITAGSFGDVLGRKRVFLFGIAAFGLASLCAGLSQTPEELIIARVVQGAAAGAMTPQVLATFRTMFPPSERGQAFGLFGAVLGFASAIGLVLGGVLTDANLFGWSWRSVFFVNVPVALVSLVAAAKLVPETRNRSAGRPDLVGAGLLIGALVAVVYPLLEGAGWVGPHGASCSWPAAWRRWSRSAWSRSAGSGPSRAASVLPRSCEAACSRSGLLGGARVAARVLGGASGLLDHLRPLGADGTAYSPLRAGLTMVAFSVGSFMLAPVAVPLAQRYGRFVLVAGAALMAAGVIGVDIGAHHVGAAAPTPGRWFRAWCWPAPGWRCL